MARFAFLVLGGLTLAGCGIVQFDVSQALPEQTVAGNPLGGVLPSFVPNPLTLTVDLKAETQKRNTGPATAVYLKALSFSATRSSGTFDFLDQVHVFIEAPGLSKVEIAMLSPVGKGLTAVTFTVVPALNLLPYVNAGATLTATATGHQPTQDFTFDGLVVLDVRV
jgi:hypothetical protein